MFYSRYRLLRFAKENTILFSAGCVSPLDARNRIPCSGRAPLKPVESPENRWPQGLEIFVRLHQRLNTSCSDTVSAITTRRISAAVHLDGIGNGIRLRLHSARQSPRLRCPY